MGAICARAAAAILGKDNVTVLERTAEHATQLQDAIGVECITALPAQPELSASSTLPTQPTAQFDYVVLAVKPQDTVAACTPLRSMMQSAVIISVMAGVVTPRLVELTGSQKVVRCMPNTPARLGQGITGWTATATVTAVERTFITHWLKQFGTSLYVESDDWIDKITAVSGSGPGYVFAFAADLVAGAQQLGFTLEQANALVQQTLTGAAALWHREQTSPEQLRQQVTSNGGTTAAALEVLNETHVTAIWQRAIQAAYERAKALSAND